MIVQSLKKFQFIYKNTTNLPLHLLGNLVHGEYRTVHPSIFLIVAFLGLILLIWKNMFRLKDVS